jgi:hypothetical protein
VTVPWANLDDQFPKHPKVIGLSDAAFRLQVSGICYCAQYRTNGLIPAEVVPLLVIRFKPAALNELTSRGLWVPLLDDGAYEVHDFLQWNRSREEIESERERKSKAGKKGMESRWHK